MGAILAIALALLLAACGTSTESDTAIESQAKVDVMIQVVDGDGSWTNLSGASVSGTLDAELDVRGKLGSIDVILDGAETLAVLEGEPYAFVLDATELATGSHALVIEAESPNGKSTSTVESVTFEVVEAPAITDDGTTDDGTTDDGTTDDGTTDDGETWSGPMVIDEGGTYSGQWESLETGTPAVSITTSEPVVIENSTIRSADDLISANWVDADVTIRNVAGEALYPTEAGAYAGRFLHAEGYRRVVVENSYMNRTSGIYLNSSEVGATVRIVANRADDVDGRKADGNGGYDGFHLVQFVQLNRGNDLRNSEIAWNSVINLPYESRVEDVINLHGTSGDADDAIDIHHNYIEGAYAADPANDSFSGGGILVGDNGGGFVDIYENRVVSTSNHGIAIAGGHDNRVYDNTVVSCGLLPDGSSIAAQNVGAYVWDTTDEPFYDNVGWGNSVAWAHPENERNDWWVPDAADWTDNVKIDEGQSVDCSLQDDVYAGWLEDTQQVDVTVGLLGPG